MALGETAHREQLLELGVPVLWWRLGSGPTPVSLPGEHGTVDLAGGAWRRLPPPAANRFFGAPRDRRAGRLCFAAPAGERRGEYERSFEHSVDVAEPPGPGLAPAAAVVVNLREDVGPWFSRSRARGARGRAHRCQRGALAVARPRAWARLPRGSLSSMSFSRVRMRGRAKAERYRASSVFAGLAADLRAELRPAA